MKCTCSRQDLNDALNAVVRAVAIKPTSPILAGIYLRAENNTLELQATNFSLRVIAKIPANVEANGATVVIGKYLPPITQKLSGEIVTLSNEANPAALTLKSEAASFEILTMDPDDFPRIHKEDPLRSFSIAATALKNLINRTIFACSKDDSRPLYTGCNIEISASDITFVGTNTHRIAIARDKIFDAIEPLQFIVPAPALRNLLAVLLNPADNLVTVDLSDRDVAFSFDNLFISSRIIDGSFPPYNRIIPATCAVTASIERTELVRALERMLIIAQLDKSNAVRFDFSEGGLEISADSFDIGKSVEHLDSHTTGDALTISFNLSYLTDALKAFNSKLITIGANAPLSPVVIRSDDDDSFTYVVTPLRTHDN